MRPRSKHLRAGPRDERGDIPGWVMVTVLTITLAIALFAIFQDALTDYLQTALDNLSN